MSAAGPGRRMVHLDLRDIVVRFALSFAVEQAGWARAGAAGRGVAVVADHLHPAPDRPPVDVLVVAPTPAASRRAVEAFTGGRARSLVDISDPGALPRALEALGRGLNVVSGELVSAAHRFPLLTPRLEQTLTLIVRGRCNRDIARELRLSEATTKRDVAELLRRFDAPNRVALASTALRLGLPPDGRP